MLLTILTTIAAFASAITAIGTFIIYKRNSKPRIRLTILNKDPFCIATQENNYRNLYYIDEQQQNAMIQIEIENQSSVSGTITDIFIHPKNSSKISQAMTSYKDYSIPPLKIRVEDENAKERYNENYQAIKQPITIKPYGYMTGFLFFANFQATVLSNNLCCILEYRIAGIDKYYSQEINLQRVLVPFYKVQDILESDQNS